MLFISTFRGKLGIVGLAACVILVIKGVNLGLSITGIFAEAGIPMVIFLFTGISFLIPDLMYLADGAQKVWDRWGEAGEQAEAADYKKVTFLGFYPKTRYALSEDENGRRVATTLIRCSCREFKKNRVPCLHMHRLADLLDVHDAPVKD